MPIHEIFKLDGVDGESLTQPIGTIEPDSFVFATAATDDTAADHFEPYRKFHFRVDAGGSDSDTTEVHLPPLDDVTVHTDLDQTEY